tara:strand:+ start:42 stop:275 length:234 start_codon:yes stop_codon:yes gene_type:complete
MITNLIEMNGYGLFIWLSFIISITACSIVYYKTKKTLKKYEKEFAAEIEKLSNYDKKILLDSSKIANEVLATNNKTA